MGDGLSSPEAGRIPIRQVARNLLNRVMGRREQQSSVTAPEPAKAFQSPPTPEPKTHHNDTQVEQVKVPRHVIFGDISIIEELTDTSSPEEFQRYQENFVLFQRLVGSAQTLDERTFLSSRLVFRTIMGLEPESGFFANEGRTLFRAMERVGIKDRFAIMAGGKYVPEIVFVHTQAAEQVLRKYSRELDIQLPDGQLSREQVAAYVKALYSQPDLRRSNYAIGLLSGFPKDAVDYFVSHNTHFGAYPLRTLDTKLARYLTASGPAELDPERVQNIYTRDYLQYGDAKPLEAGTKVGIHGFGTGFTTSYPPSDEVRRYCQRLLEIDRKLGVTQYIQRVRTSA